MNPLFLVPARGGSRRLPGKNAAEVAGIPLLGMAVRRARRAAARLGIASPVVICSTDDDELARIATEWGASVPFLRPSALAGDESSSADVALHAVDALAATGIQTDVIVLLQPTSPLLDDGDVVRAIELHQRTGASVATVSPAHHGIRFATHDGPLRDRGDGAAGDPVDLNGGCYVIATDELRGTGAFVTAGTTRGLPVPAARSVDVDTAEDLAMARALAAARPVSPVQIADRSIGDGACLVIAELGVNHDGRVEVGIRLIEAAATAGADAVKVQSFSTDRLVAREAALAAYQLAAGETGDQRRMLSRLELSADDHRTLQQCAADRGVLFLSSPFDLESARMLDELGVPAFKIGSGELTHGQLLAAAAAYGRPMLVSTGMATMRDVARAVDVIEAAGNERVVLLHCVSNYPAEAEASNLAAMQTMRAAFGHPVGWSDHTAGIETSVGAVLLGASVIEKHLTLDRSLPGPDHHASIEPKAFGDLVRAIRTAERVRGSGRKVPDPAEAEVAAAARRSLHWAADLAAGWVVTAQDLVALRPGTGIEPYRTDAVVGRRTVRPVQAGSMVRPDDLEPHPEGQTDA